MARTNNTSVKGKKGSSAKNSTKKRSTSKKTSSTKRDAIKDEIISLFIVAFAIFLIVVTNKENQIGIIGNTINIILHSAFGKGAGFFSYIVLFIGLIRLLYIVLETDNNQSIAFLGFFITYTIYSALRDENIYQLLLSEDGFIHFINTSFELGKLGQGGGLLGNIISFVSFKLVGKNGTIIFLIALFFSFTILLTNQSIIGIVKIIGGYIKGFFNFIYNFLFVEIEDYESEEKKQKEEKIKNVKKTNRTTRNKLISSNKSSENIEIYDCDGQTCLTDAEDENIKDKRKVEITSLQFEDEKVEEKIGKNKKGNTVNEDESTSNSFAENLKKTATIKDNKEYSDSENKKIKKTSNTSKSAVETFEKQDVTDDLINISGVPIQKYKLPSSNLLKLPSATAKSDKNELIKDGEKLIETLANFNIPCNILQINKGPTITRYEIQPAPGIKVSKITGLSNDIKMALATSDIRMEAPIPGKSAIGIEVPNRVKTSVYLRNLIESKEYKTINTNIPFALGKDIAGKNIVGAINTMPHLLIAGATGAGKSVCINTLIMSILFKAKPEDVKLILIDPKVVELSVYNGLPHLLIPVVTDPRKAANALEWAVSEMTNRYKVFATKGVRDIFSYNEKVSEENEDKMAQIVIVIDELADLMTVASNEVEECITRIAQLARACGIHLVIATQRPSVDVITGVIKANIPSRIAFAVSSQIDSRTILDMAGAEKLLGKGDMLYYPMGMSKPMRIQGTFISDDEIKRVVDNIKEQTIEMKIQSRNDIMEEIEKQKESPKDADELLEKAVELVVYDEQASTSYIQRKLKVGYARAARIMDQLEERGIVSGADGSKQRRILITKEELEEMKN